MNRVQFERLARKVEPQLGRSAIPLCGGDSELAKDAVQETLLRAWRAKDTLQDVTKFESWIYVILRNVCHNLREAKLRMKSLDQMKTTQDFDPIDETTPSIQTLIETEAIQEAFETVLSEEEKLAIFLYRYLGYTSEEVGVKMNMPASSVRTLVQRALEKVRKYLDDKESE